MTTRTDLAVECIQLEKKPVKKGMEVNEYENGNIKVSKISITDNNTANEIGKPIGNYVTVELPKFSGSVEYTNEEIEIVSKEISNFLPKDGLILVAGLGNINITPDALGYQTVEQILATRHIFEQAKDMTGLEYLRPVAAITPGVLGRTGIETSEIIKGICDKISPVAIIVIDALASKNVSRLGNTIQISDTGISPGSGVLNKRKEISQSTMGVKVIAIGVPTVVDAATLISDTLCENQEQNDKMRDNMSKDAHTMMVTPREIDLIIQRGAKVLSMAINKALQPEIGMEELAVLTV